MRTPRGTTEPSSALAVPCGVKTPWSGTWSATPRTRPQPPWISTTKSCARSREESLMVRGHSMGHSKGHVPYSYMRLPITCVGSSGDFREPPSKTRRSTYCPNGAGSRCATLPRSARLATHPAYVCVCSLRCSGQSSSHTPGHDRRRPPTASCPAPSCI